MTHRLAAAAGALIAVALVATTLPAQGVEPRRFENPAQEQRYRDLLEELRCLVCQNQSLSDSNADLAKDLRREVHDMIVDGASDEKIVDFLVARYGDFVLYRPPVKPTTWLLWFGPFALGALALGVLIAQVRRRRRHARADADLSEAQRRRAQALLADPGERGG